MISIRHVIIIAERGTIQGQKPLVMYTENGKTPWESQQYTEALDKYRSLLGKLPVVGIFADLTNEIFDPDRIRGKQGERGEKGESGELPQEVLARIADIEARVKKIEDGYREIKTEEKVSFEKLY